jgi:hypothetical protein
MSRHAKLTSLCIAIAEGTIKVSREAILADVTHSVVLLWLIRNR